MMTLTDAALPVATSRDEWLGARKALLAKEKGATRQRDALSAERRRLPMVRIDKALRLRRPGGRRASLDLFEGRRQLIVYHFMFDPSWDEGCPSCSYFADTSATSPPARARHVASWWSRARRSPRSSPSSAAWAGRSLVLVVRQRLQLRLPRHARRGRRAGRVQLRAGELARGGLFHAGRAARPERLPARRRRASSTPTRPTRAASTCSSARTTSST